MTRVRIIRVNERWNGRWEQGMKKRVLIERQLIINKKEKVEKGKEHFQSNDVMDFGLIFVMNL